MVSSRCRSSSGTLFGILNRLQSLLDSILKGYPIGTFILWETDNRINDVKNIGNFDLPEIEYGPVQYVLDGQQRITSLFAAYKGASIQKVGEKKKTNYKDSGVGSITREHTPRNRQSYDELPANPTKHFGRQLQDERVSVSSRHSHARLFRQVRKSHERQSSVNFDGVINGYRDTVNLVFSIPPLDHPELLRILAEQNRYLGIQKS